MRKIIMAVVLIMGVVVGSGCAYYMNLYENGEEILKAQMCNRWTPSVGCSENILLSQWGYGGDTSLFLSSGETYEVKWYNMDGFTGIVFPGISGSGSRTNFCVHLCCGVVTNVSIH